MKVLMLSGDVATIRGEKGPFYSTLEGLSKYWDEIHVLCPPGKEKRVLSLFPNVQLTQVKGHKLFVPLTSFFETMSLVKDKKIDLVISHDFGLMLNGLAAFLFFIFLGIPFVSEIHHIEGHPKAVTLKDKFYFFWAKIYLKTIGKFAKGIRLVNRGEIFQLLTQKWNIPQEAILVVPSIYLDLNVFKPIPEMQKQFDLIFCGRLVSNKGIFELLDLTKRMLQKRPQFKFLIVGRGELKDKTLERIQYLDIEKNVTMIEWVATTKDIAEIYAKSKILVCASTAEGGPRVTVEAMACGIPVISTPVGIMPDLIKQGENGFLYQWKIQELERYLEELLSDDDLYQKISQSSVISVEHFSFPVAVKFYADSYLKLVKM